MHILVTGGAGYIGAHVVRDLVDRGFDVVVIDRVETAPERRAKAAYVRGDVADRPLLVRLLREHAIQAVVHLAADKAVEESVHDPLRYFHNNVTGTATVLQAMAETGCRIFVFSSSAAVYGQPPRMPVSERSAPSPQNPYGESKWLVERMLPWLDRAHGVRYASLRYFNAAGAALDGTLGEGTSSARNLVPLVVDAAFRGTALTVFGADYPTTDGTAVRDYVHVHDLARAHAAAVEYLHGDGRSSVINLGTGRGHSVLEVVDATRRMTGRPVDVTLGPRREGDPPAVWADVSKARAVLGWQALHGLDEIVRTAWLSRVREGRSARGDGPHAAATRGDTAGASPAPSVPPPHS